MTVEDKQVVIRQNGALVAGGAHDDLDAFGDLDADEMVLPTMRLVQGVSRPPIDASMAGHFYDTLRKDYKPVLHVSILAFKRSRSLFVEGDFDAPPLCASDDAVAPREVVRIDMGNGQTIDTGPKCARCAFAQWGTSRGGKGKGQACTMAYNLLCLDLDDQSIYVVRVTGVSILGFREYFTAGKMSKTPAYALTTVIGSEQRIFDSGAAHVLIFEAGEHLDPEMATAMREQAARYRGRSLGVEGDPDVLDAEDEDEFPMADIEAQDIPTRDINADVPVAKPMRATVAPDAVPEGETHMSNCASLGGGKCDCDASDIPMVANSTGAPEKIEPEDIPFETADDFPPNPPMMTEAQKGYLFGGDKVPRENALARKWAEHAGGTAAIIAALDKVHPDIAAGIYLNKKADALLWRTSQLTEGQAEAMIGQIKRELGIGTRKKKEPVG